MYSFILGNDAAAYKAAIDLEKSGVQIIVVTVRLAKVPDGYTTVAPDKTSIVKTDKEDDPKDVAKEIDELTKKGKAQ